MRSEENRENGNGSAEPHAVFHFGPYTFELPAHRLSRDGIDLPIAPKAAAVLRYLLQRPGELVSKDEFLERVWEDVYAREESLTQAISVIRRALGDSSHSPRFIQTITGEGYRFIAAVSENGWRPPTPEEAIDLPPQAGQDEGPNEAQIRANETQIRASEPPEAEVRAARIAPDAAPPSTVKDTVPRLPWIIAAVALSIAAVAVWRTPLEPVDPGTTRPLRFSFDLPEGTVLPRFNIDVAPAGDRVAFVTQASDGSRQLYVWDSSTDLATPLPGTEDISPTLFFSPDGEWVGFFAGSSLKKVAVSGGRPETIATLPITAAYVRGATWTDANQIVYSYQRGGLHMVSADGGRPVELSREDWWYTDALPGGRVLLGARADGPDGPLASADEATISALWLDRQNSESIVLHGGYMPRYVPPGYLVFVLEGSLLAAPFDARTAQVTGPPVRMVDSVRANQGVGAATYAVSPNGTLAFVAGGDLPDRDLLLVDRDGNSRSLVKEARAFHQVAVSPGATKLALTIGWHAHQLWLLDLSEPRPVLDPLVLGFDVHYPAWMPDGASLVFNVAEGEAQNLFRISAPGAPPERLTRSGAIQRPFDVSSDGRDVIFAQGANADLWILPVDHASEPRKFIATSSNETSARLHPGGRFVAYQSDRSGDNQIYVAPYPAGHPSTRISTAGGVSPRWSPDGNELFYQSAGSIWSVDVTVGAMIARGTPERLFEVGLIDEGPHWDVLPDGRGFVIISGETPAPITKISVVVNWVEELERSVPAGR